MTDFQLPENWDKIRNGIFAGESGGDYDALFGYSNRPGGRWEGVRLTNMTVDEAIAFSDPKGAYGQWVKSELGRLGQRARVATPMGAYQIVGTTLREAKKALGLTGSELMSPETQEMLGQYIYRKQGTGAWEGYKGPMDDYTAMTEGVSSGVQWDDTTYAGINAPSGIDRQEQFEFDTTPGATPDAYETWWKEIGAAYESSSFTAHLHRWASEGQSDPFYSPAETFDVETLKQFPDHYHDMLLGSTSATNAASRIQWVEEDMMRRGRLEQGGWSAVGAELVSGIIDPVPLVAGVATGGVGVATRAGLLGRMASSAASGAAFNVALDTTGQYVFDDPYADPVLAGIVGAAFGTVGGIIAGNPAAARYGKHAASRGHKIATGQPLGDTGHLRSVGAAENPNVIDPLIRRDDSYLSEIADDAVPYGGGGKLDFSVTGQMVSSDNPLVRQTGFILGEVGPGARGNSVTPDSVSSVQRAVDRVEQGNFMAEYHPSRLAWMREQNIFALNLFARHRANREFSQLVSKYVEAPETMPDASPHVVRAANAFSKGMKSYNQRMRDSGLAHLDDNPNYVPKIADDMKVAEIDMRFRAEDIERIIGEAILAHTPGMADHLVKAMARGYWKNLRKAAYGVSDDMDRMIATQDFDGFKRLLKEALEDTESLGEKEMKEAFNALSAALDDAKPRDRGNSASVGYLKRRTLLDYNKSFDLLDRKGQPAKLAVRDFFHDDAEMLFRRYSRNMSARVAFAEMKLTNPSKMEVIIDGVKNEADIQRWKDLIVESYRQTGRPRSEWERKLKNDLENLDFMWKRISGIPVWDNASSFNRWARRLKTMQFVRLMSNMGLNQIQESAKIMTILGARASLSQMPSIRQIARTIRSGEFDGDQLAKELMHMTGIGNEGRYERLDMKLADDRIGYSPTARWEQGLDNFLDAASEFTANISFFRAIQDYQQQWATRAITQRMVDMGRKARRPDGTFDLSKVAEADWNRLASVGFGKEDAETLFRHLIDHGEFSGGRITGLNIPKWDPDMVSKYRLLLNRYTDRLVQMNDHGALAKWMSHPIASMFVQFRAFVFGAWGKSTLWSLNNGGLKDPRVLTMILAEIVAGTATYVTRNSHLLATEEGRQKFEEEVLDPVNAVASGWARTTTASILPMMIDSVLTLGHGAGFEEVEPIFGNARASGSAADAFLGSPAIDQGQAMVRAVKGITRSTIYGDDYTQRDARALMRALPIPGNYVPVTAALGALIEDLPE